MDVKLPKLGEGADSGVVVGILVQEGDRVEEGQPLIELENEKAVASIPSSAAGVVGRIRVKQGDTLTVGAVILTLEEPGDRKAPAKPAPASAARSGKASEREASSRTPRTESPPPASDEVPSRSDAAPVASPSVRRLAKDLGLDLGRVRGTERGGRIGMKDVRTYVELLQRLAFPGQDKAGTVPGTPTGPVAETVDFSRWGPVKRQALSALRRTIVRRMSESWSTTPRVTQFDEADITRLNELRKEHAAAYEARGVRLTLTAFMVGVTVDALRKHPVFNSSLDEAAGALVVKEYYHIGLAVDTEAGLMVPVIRNADRKSLVELCREIETLAAKARDRKVALEELQGGTFTISNQGGIGGGPFTPIVNRPEVAILGLGRGALKPMVRDGRIEARLVLPLALSYDHRVIDGGAAARFVVELVRGLEEFREDRLELNESHGTDTN